MEDYKKKYEDALERAREMCAMPTDKATMEYVFPELKESEEEKARKELVEWLKRKLVNPSIGFNPAKMEKWIAYLEKMKDFDKQLEEAYKNSDEVQYKRGYDAAMMEITCTEREAAAKTIRELQERINELSHSPVTKKSDQDNKWTEEDEKMFEEYKLGIQALMKDAYVEKFCNWIFTLKQKLLQ